MELQPEEYVAPVQPADSYNGARNDKFTWSQTISDLDVIVKIPEFVKTANDLRVDISPTKIKIEVVDPRLNKSDRQNKDSFELGESFWTTIFEGQLSFPIKKNESIWSLVSGRHVNINLEKSKERWWQALIEGEEKLDLKKMDCSRNLHELADDEQAKIAELMWKEKEKFSSRLS